MYVYWPYKDYWIERHKEEYLIFKILILGSTWNLK